MVMRRKLMFATAFGLAMLVIALVLVLGPTNGLTFAASTTKLLSTNFTLVNLGPDTADVLVQYLLDTGATWTAPAASTQFTITGNGGQMAIRQYFDTMDPLTGRGSAIVSSNQPLGAVVQIQARNQVNTFAAYKGYTAGSTSFYMPLLSRRGNSASGPTNALIAIQNADTVSVTVDVKFLDVTGVNNYTKTLTINPGVTYYYDLDTETNLSVLPWNGSGVVAARNGGKVAVVVNSFVGANTLQAYNAFPVESIGKSWLIPIFTSRLANGLSTVLRVQNVSGGDIPIGGVEATCTRNSTDAPTTLVFTNTTAVANNKFFEVNPVINSSIPGTWQGSCQIDTTPANTVALVQMRVVGGGAEDAASYEALSGAGLNTKVIVPLVAKRLPNGFATVVNIQNVSTSQDANVTLTYKHSSGPGGDLSTTTVISAGQSIQENQRLSGFSVGGTPMPDNWQGTLTVSSNNGVPLDAIVQLTFYVPHTGDTLQAHDAFTLP